MPTTDNGDLGTHDPSNLVPCGGAGFTAYHKLIQTHPLKDASAGILVAGTAEPSCKDTKRIAQGHLFVKTGYSTPRTWLLPRIPGLLTQLADLPPLPISQMRKLSLKKKVCPRSARR